MYRSTTSRRYGSRHSNMLIKSLPSPRWLLFILISAGYFIFTIYILSYNQECPDKGKSHPRDIKHENTKADSDSQIDSNARIIDAEYYTGDAGDDSQVTKDRKTKSKIGPIGTRMALPHESSKSEARKTSQKQYDPDLLPHNRLLDRRLTANTVYMVWCGRRWFEFHHYLSVVSVIKHLRPDLIKFYYNHHPIYDNWVYNTWFDELKDAYPFFYTEELPKEHTGCLDHNMPNMDFVNGLLTSTGGVYISEHTILAKYPISYRLTDFVYAFDPISLKGFISAKSGLPGNQKHNIVLQRPNSTKLSCVSMSGYNEAEGNAVCVNTHGVFYPAEIWQHPSHFARLVRTLFYGNPEPVDAKPSDEVLIPNIAHMVWIGGGRMDYLFFLSVLSLIYVAEVDMVYIHGDGPPSGDLWERIKDHPNLKLIYREVPTHVYGQRVRVLSHVTDIWRVDFMIKYGGIYVDTDTVFVQKLDKEIRSYDAVGSYDWTYWNPPFPDTINFGVALGKRNATYWHEFQKSMKWFKDDDWSWNGLRQPYRVKERHPHLAKIDPRLQVICYLYKCHPTWWPNYHNESIHHLSSQSINDWRKDTYVFHWTLPTPPELDNEELLMNATTMAAEVGRNVLQKAGLLEEIRANYRRKAMVTKPPTQNHNEGGKL